jgi:hypothetical protein
MRHAHGLLACCLAVAASALGTAVSDEPPPLLLHASLEPASSSGPCTVLQLQQSTVPAATTWFRLRRAEPNASMPAPIHPDRHSGAGFWFLRTPPKPAGQLPREVQQLAFQAAGMFNAGLEPTIVPVNLTGGGRAQLKYVAEAWSERSDLATVAGAPPARLLATSAVMTFSFDDRGFSAGLHFQNFTATDLAPGWVTVRAHPSDAALYSLAKSVTWAAFQPTGRTNTSTGRPLFALDTALQDSKFTTREFPHPEINVSWSQPGVYYVGIYGAWNGRYGFSYPKPENGVRTYFSSPLVGGGEEEEDSEEGEGEFQPLAIVIPFENGSHPVPGLPRGFAGPVFIGAAIPGDQRLALMVRGITVFDGGTAHLPLLHGASSPQSAPETIEMDVPEGLTVIPPERWSFENDYGESYTTATDVTNVTGGGAVPLGYKRLRLGKPAGAAWDFQNTTLRLYVAVEDQQIVGRVFPHARIRGYTLLVNGSGGIIDRDRAKQVRADNWQPLALTVKALRPVATLPKRLHMDFSWASFDEFAPQVKERSFLRRFILNRSSWPRQARDKRRESSKTDRLSALLSRRLLA